MIIPEKLSDIKVKTFLEYQDYFNSLKEEERESHDAFIKKLCIFFNITIDEYIKIPFTTAVSMNNIINNLLEMKQDLVPTFKLGKVEYGINPNFDDLTFAEMVDCDTDDVIKQIAILYRPIIKKKGKKYLIEPYKADIKSYDLFKEELTLDVYLGFITFFLRIQNALLSYTLKSLMEMDLSPEQRKSLEESGVGSLGFMNYATVISQN